jgi:NAD(P)-dependent dehydrogenase (short-subunit alcohol dehydrogenase family)
MNTTTATHRVAPRSFDLQGKVVLITGASSGMGLAAAQAFAREGARLILGARRSDEGEAIADAIRRDGGEAAFLATDVSREQDVEKLVGLALERHGRLDVAFNNAGTEGLAAPLEEQTNENWDQVINTNVRGVFWSMKHEIRAMRRGGGAIVNNASMGSEIGFSNLAAYIASKHAVMGLTKTAALENFKRGIRVNAVNPGLIDTALQDRLWGSEAGKLDFARQSVPGRLGTAQEVADAVLFLASDRASYFSGQGLVVDGGYVVQ